MLKEERVVVFGAGGLGLMCASLLGVPGGAGVVVVEPHAQRRDAALAGGAVAAIDPAEPDVVARIESSAGGTVWAVIDCAGSAQTVQLSLDALVKGGQLIRVGLFGGQITLPTPTVPICALSIVGSYVGSLQELKDLIALVRAKPIHPSPITCRCLPEAARALQDLEDGKVVGRVVLQP